MMLAAAGKNRIVTLDIPGKPWDTPQLARELERWKQDGRDVSLLIGGPEGSLRPVKQQRNRVGRSPPSRCLTRWYAYWSLRACIVRGALPPTTLTTVNNDDQGRLSSE
jgi:hypothetical protein